MTTKLRFLVVVVLMVAAVLAGAAQTAKADPTPCTVGCDDEG